MTRLRLLPPRERRPDRAETLHVGDLADTPQDVVRRVVELNLTAAILVARRVVQQLVQGGAIVNVSSAAATLGAPHEYVHYAAAGDPGRLERVAPKVPMGRVGAPEEVAEAIAWLLGDGCPYATGATLRVAGGR